MNYASIQGRCSYVNIIYSFFFTIMIELDCMFFIGPVVFSLDSGHYFILFDVRMFRYALGMKH